MKRNVVLAVLIVTLVVQPLSPPWVDAAENVRDRNPDAAFWMGFFLPGGGQFYNSQNWEGLKELFWEGFILVGVAGGIAFLVSTPSIPSSTRLPVAAGVGLVGFAWIMTLRLASALKASEDVGRINQGVLKP